VNHITIVEYGQFLGITSNRLVIKQNGSIVHEYSLNRLKSIQIAKNGVSFSSDLILQCAVRGIKVFILDFRGQAVACVSGVQQHAVVNTRKHQFNFISSLDVARLCSQFVYGKCRNQRATLLYFGKYQTQLNLAQGKVIKHAAEQIKLLSYTIKRRKWEEASDWRNQLLGYEGQAAHCYWQALILSNLLPDSFQGREKRNASDVVNQSLNYGYAILTSYVWHCLVNAGLEVYAGCFHTERAGKPSLVLDLMEEYRAWTVDRVVIKLRSQLEDLSELTPAFKKKLVKDIHETFYRKYSYNNRKLRLESIMQRQIYHLSGRFSGTNTYRPYLFRW
jgi:CRISP-associated protein Cas1